MESRGLFANNIVAHNGDKKTYPTGVYIQRSEAQIINNTILDPFLINFKTFDNKPNSEGLQPSVIRDNRIWGSFEVKTQVLGVGFKAFIFYGLIAQSSATDEVTNGDEFGDVFRVIYVGYAHKVSKGTIYPEFLTSTTTFGEDTQDDLTARSIRLTFKIKF